MMTDGKQLKIEGVYFIPSYDDLGYQAAAGLLLDIQAAYNLPVSVEIHETDDPNLVNRFISMDKLADIANSFISLAATIPVALKEAIESIKEDGASASKNLSYKKLLAQSDAPVGGSGFCNANGCESVPPCENPEECVWADDDGDDEDACDEAATHDPGVSPFDNIYNPPTASMEVLSPSDKIMYLRGLVDAYMRNPDSMIADDIVRMIANKLEVI